MATGQIIVVVKAVILDAVLSPKIHVCIGGQKISDGNWFEAFEAKYLPLLFILIRDHSVDIASLDKKRSSTHCEMFDPDSVAIFFVLAMTDLICLRAKTLLQVKIVRGPLVF